MMPNKESKGAKRGNSAPHGSEGRGTRQQRAIAFPCSQSFQKCPSVSRANLLGVCGVDERHGAAPVQAPHQSNLPRAERTGAVEPDRNQYHDVQMVIGPALAIRVSAGTAHRYFVARLGFAN